MLNSELPPLLQEFPRVELGLFPTPLQEIRRLTLTGGRRLFIKRDDLTGTAPGGNKIRNLQYLLGDALAQGCDLIFASGQEQSNLCTLCATACARLGLDCELIHNSLPSKKAQGNRLLNELLQVPSHFIGPCDEAARAAYVEELAEQARQRGRKPYIIYNGASTALGALGYVEMVCELVQDQQNSGIEINDMFVPGGNGGLAAGVVFGAAIFAPQLKVHVISVEHGKAELTTILTKFWAEMSELTGHQPKRSLADTAILYDEYRGAGWGIPTPEADAMIEELARSEAIFLERVYTAKCFYGMWDVLQKDRSGIGPHICFLHSGGFSSLFAQF